MKRDVIIACDFPSGNDMLEFLDLFTERKPFVKIGMELFYAEGPSIVRAVKARGCRVFLDLKLHDIPHTVGHAMRRIADLGVDLTTVHAAGGIRMMEAAREGLTGESGRSAKIVAVTQLTSTSEEMMNEELGIPGSISGCVTAYAANAERAGLDGVICSALEAPDIHAVCPPPFLAVAPGIRFEGDDRGDQTRVATPARARELGADCIVVGRSITRAANPVSAYERAIRDFAE